MLVVDATSSRQAAEAGTTATWSHTVGSGDDRLLVVFVKNGNSKTISGITYGGVALTQAIQATYTPDGMRAAIWYLIAPTAGTADVVITFSASGAEHGSGAISFFGANQTNPIGATGKIEGTITQTPSIGLTTTANGSICVDVAGQNSSGGSGTTQGAGQTAIYTFNSTNPGSTGASYEYKGVPGTCTMSWTLATNTNTVHAAVEILQSGTLAIDTNSSGSVSGASSITFSHTCSGSDRLLVVFVSSNGGNSATTGATYNGVAMTLGFTASRGKYFYLANPDTGANNVVVSFNSSVSGYAGSVSFVGADTSSPFGNTGNQSASGANPSFSFTTANDNSCILDGAASDSATLTATGTQHTTQFGPFTVSGQQCIGATKPTAGAGAYTLNFSQSTAGNTVGISNVEIKGITSIAYTITSDQGSFTLTGQAAVFHITMKMVAAQGSYTLTGQNALFAFGRGIVAGLGSFVLNGQNALLNSTRKLISAVGSFTLTGQAATFQTNRVLTALVGLYTLTGQAARGLLNGSSTWLTNLAKNAASLTNISKNSASLTNVDKNSAGLTNIEKS